MFWLFCALIYLMSCVMFYNMDKTRGALKTTLSRMWLSLIWPCYLLIGIAVELDKIGERN